MIETGIYQLLTRNADLKALIGNGVYFVKFPNKDTILPAVVMQVVSTLDFYNYAGASNLRRKLIQFDSYASKYGDSVTVSDTIRGLLESFVGTLPEGSQIEGCIVRRDIDMPYEPGT